MPYIDTVNGIYKSPAEAAQMGLCPECGRDLRFSSAAVEKRLHWPRGSMVHPDQTDGESDRREIEYRMKLIDEYYAQHPQPAATPAPEIKRYHFGDQRS